MRLLERLLRHFHRTNDASFAQALLASHLHQVLVNLVWRQARSASTPTSTNRAQAPNNRHDSCRHGNSNSDCNVDSSGADVLAECVRLVGCLLAQGHLQPGHEDAFVGEVAFVLRCGQGRLLTQAVYQAALQVHHPTTCALAFLVRIRISARCWSPFCVFFFCILYVELYIDTRWQPTAREASTEFVSYRITFTDLSVTLCH